jgi:hypothetical protein
MRSNSMHSIHRFLLDRLKKTSVIGWSSLTFGPLVLAGVFLFLIWAGTYARIHQEEKIELDNILIDNGNIARIVAVNLDEVLGKANIYADIATAIATGNRDALANFNPVLFGDHAFLRLAVFDTNARLIFSSVHSSKEPLLSALVSVAAKKSVLPRTMIIGRPDTGNGDIWRVPVILPLGEHAKSGFLGGHLDLGYFLRLYQDINLGRNGKIEIIGDDRYQMIESSGSTIFAGKNIAASEYLAFEALAKRLA